MDFNHQIFTSYEHFCHFLLAQKVTKKGTLPNASARNAYALLAGQRGQPAFFLLVVCA